MTAQLLLKIEQGEFAKHFKMGRERGNNYNARKIAAPYNKRSRVNILNDDGPLHYSYEQARHTRMQSISNSIVTTNVNGEKGQVIFDGKKHGIFSHVIRAQGWISSLNNSCGEFKSKYAKMPRYFVDATYKTKDELTLLTGYSALAQYRDYVTLFRFLSEEQLLASIHVDYSKRNRLFSGNIIVRHNTDYAKTVVENWFGYLAHVLKSVEEERTAGRYHGEVSKNEAYEMDAPIIIDFKMSNYLLRVLKCHSHRDETSKSSFLYNTAGPQQEERRLIDDDDSDDEELGPILQNVVDKKYIHHVSANGVKALEEIKEFATNLLKYKDEPLEFPISECMAVLSNVPNEEIKLISINDAISNCPREIDVEDDLVDECHYSILESTLSIPEQCQLIKQTLAANSQFAKLKSKIRDLAYFPGKCTLHMSMCFVNSNKNPVSYYFTEYNPKSFLIKANEWTGETGMILRGHDYKDLPLFRICYPVTDTYIIINCYDKYQEKHVTLIIEQKDHIEFKSLSSDTLTHSIAIENMSQPWESFNLELTQQKSHPLDKSDNAYYYAFVQSITYSNDRIYYVLDEALEIESIQRKVVHIHDFSFKESGQRQNLHHFEFQVVETSEYVVDPIDITKNGLTGRLKVPLKPEIAKVVKTKTTFNIELDVFKMKYTDIPFTSHRQFEEDAEFDYKMKNLEDTISVAYEVMLQNIPLLAD